MQIEFNQSEERFIKTAVEQGHFLSEDDVVREAVRKMRDEQAHKERLRAAVALGDADIAAGRTVTLTDSWWEESTQAAIDHAEAGEKATKSDVLP